MTFSVISFSFLVSTLYIYSTPRLTVARKCSVMIPVSGIQLLCMLGPEWRCRVLTLPLYLLVRINSKPIMIYFQPTLASIAEIDFAFYFFLHFIELDVAVMNFYDVRKIFVHKILWYMKCFTIQLFIYRLHE